MAILHATDPRIPEQWRPYWEPVPEDEKPDVLLHLTSPFNAQAIIDSGAINPLDPAPRDWDGLHAVFMCHAEDPSFQERLPNLLDHFFRKSNVVHGLWIQPDLHLHRCRVDIKRSYYISLDPVPTSLIVNHHSFAQQVPRRGVGSRP